MVIELDPVEPLKPIDLAVEAALLKNHQAFLRFLARRLGDKQEAEDALQNFYLKVLSKSHGIRRSESVVAWLYRTLRSTLVDHYRARQRRTRHEATYAREQERQAEPSDVDLHAMICECLYKLLSGLRGEYAEILWRVDLIGESRQRVARDLDLTMNNLTVRLHRARQALKSALLLSCETCPEHGFLDCACDLPVRRLRASTSA